MASDLDGLYNHYRARGLNEDEAVRRTGERLVASPDTLRQLVLVHTTGYQRLLGRAAGGLRLGFDLVLFGLAVVPLLAFSGQVVGAQLRDGGTGVFTGIVMGIGGVITGITLFKAYQLFVRRERSPAKLHRGLFTMLVLAGHGALVGMIEFVITLYRVAQFLGRQGSAAVQLSVAEAVGRGAAALGLGILTAIGAALVWFVLVNRIAAIERSERAAVLAG